MSAIQFCILHGAVVDEVWRTVISKSSLDRDASVAVRIVEQESVAAGTYRNTGHSSAVLTAEGVVVGAEGQDGTALGGAREYRLANHRSCIPARIGAVVCRGRSP